MQASTHTTPCRVYTTPCRVHIQHPVLYAAMLCTNAHTQHTQPTETTTHTTHTIHIQATETPYNPRNAHATHTRNHRCFLLLSHRNHTHIPVCSSCCTHIAIACLLIQGCEAYWVVMQVLWVCRMYAAYVWYDHWMLTHTLLVLLVEWLGDWVIGWYLQC